MVTTATIDDHVKLDRGRDGVVGHVIAAIEQWSR